jgi:hypothetical protein
MGLSTTGGNDSQKNYLNILGGKITQRVKEGTEGAVSRINKQNKEVWELHFDTLSGRIVDFNLEESDYGKVWVVTIQSGIDYYYLHLQQSGRITNGLMHRLPNIDLSKEIVIKTFRIFNEDKQRDQDYLVVYQGGTAKSNKIEGHYTKKGPDGKVQNINGLPEMVQIKVKGNLVWDDSAQIEFITNMVLNEVKPKLNGDAPKAEYKEPSIKDVAAAKNAAKAQVADPELDDLPF